MVAHRGDSEGALENTVESCLRAAAAGAAMLEVDVQLTKDGELVVFHDWDLRRLAGRPGVVEQLPAAALVELPLALTRRGRRLTGRAPTLVELLEQLPPQLPVNLELKRRRAPGRALVERLREVTHGRPQLLVSSFDVELLTLVRRLLPRRPVAPIASRDAQALAAAAVALDAWSVHCHTRIAAEVLERAGQRPVLVYTVNRAPELRRFIGLGVAGVFTDRPGGLLAAVGRLPPLC